MQKLHAQSLHNRILVDAIGEPYGFTLHNMDYLFTLEQQQGKPDEPCKVILAGDVHKRAISDLISKGTVTLGELELLAVECIKSFYDDMSLSSSELALEVHGDEKIAISTPAGTIAIVTDHGGIYSLMAKSPRDVFTFRKFLSKFPSNYGLATVGSKAHALYDKLGYDIEDIDEKNNLLSLVRFNWKDDNPVRDVRAIAEELGWTIWRFQDATVPIYPNTE